MNPLEIVTTIVSTLCMITTAILTWVMIYRTTKTEVSFTGNPVDKADFDKTEAAHAAVHAQLFAKIGGAERGLESRLTAKIDAIGIEDKESRRVMHKDIETIGREVSALQATSETNAATLIRVEGKFDRMLERQSE